MFDLRDRRFQIGEEGLESFKHLTERSLVGFVKRLDRLFLKEHGGEAFRNELFHCVFARQRFSELLCSNA